MKIPLSSKLSDVSKSSTRQKFSLKPQFNSKSKEFKYNKALNDIFLTKNKLIGESESSESKAEVTFNPDKNFKENQSSEDQEELEQKSAESVQTKEEYSLTQLDAKIKVMLEYLGILEYFPCFVKGKFLFEDLLLMEKCDLVEIELPVMPRNRVWFFLVDLKQSDFDDLFQFIEYKNKEVKDSNKSEKQHDLIENRGEPEISQNKAEKQSNVKNQKTRAETRKTQGNKEEHKENQIEDLVESLKKRKRALVVPRKAKSKLRKKSPVDQKELNAVLNREERVKSHKVDCLARNVREPYLADYFRNVEEEMKLQKINILPIDPDDLESKYSTSQWAKGSQMGKIGSSKNLIGSAEFSFSKNEDLSDLKHESSLKISDPEQNTEEMLREEYN